MSSFGSSVINKSSRKFAPKVAAQRRRPANALPAPVIPEVQNHQLESDIGPQPSNVDSAAPARATSPSPPLTSHPLTSPPVPTTEAPDEVPSQSHLSDPSAIDQRDDTAAHAIRVPRAVARQVTDPRPTQAASAASARHQDQHEEGRGPVAKRRRIASADEHNEIAVDSAVAVEVARSTVERPRNTRSRSDRVSSSRAEVGERPASPPAEQSPSEAPQPSEEGEDQEVQSAASTGKRKGRKAPKVSAKPRAPRKKKVATAGPEPSTAGEAENRPTVVPRRRRRRQDTPEDAENIEIAPTILKMSELCRDLRTGKKSNRQRELEKLDAISATEKRIRREREQSGVGGREAPVEEESVDERLERLERERRPPVGGHLTAPQMRVVDGRIVVDDQSLQIDRHAAATAAAPAMEEVVENELTRRINSGTWMKRTTAEQWNEDAVDKFYLGLRMFGTDFQMISKMLPGKTRRHVKNKFLREERINLQGINDALAGQRTGTHLDLVVYSKLTKVKYEEVAKFETELKEEAEKLKAQEERLVSEARELQQRRRRENNEQVAANAAMNDESLHGNGDLSGTEGTDRTHRDRTRTRAEKAPKAKQPPKKPKNALQLSRHGGGEEVEVLGTVGDLIGAAA